MKFGPTPLDDAEGAVLAHSVRHGALIFKKGRRLTADDIAALRGAGLTSVLAARLEPGDVHEDGAARRLAAALAGTGVIPAPPFTGRANLVADRAGLVLIERAVIDAINRIDEGLTVATLSPFARADAKSFLATIKIIPFAVSEHALAEAEKLASYAPAICVAPFRALRAAYVTSADAASKTARLTQERLARLGSRFVGEPVTALDHDAAAIEFALRQALRLAPDLILVEGRSATVDRRDVVPQAIVAAGGTISHFGMPVDPGNLLMLARLGGAHIIVLPGCAGSPKENGFDWVLERLHAGLEVKPEDIQAMGVGGLLKEAPRPQPRAARTTATHPRVAGILLAAGLSRRMGRNKLLESSAGKSLVRHAGEAAARANLAARIAVTGHEAERVESELAGLGFTIVRASRFEDGMSASLKAGLRVLPGNADAALILLGDMPALRAEHIDRLVAAYDPEEGRTICVPVFEGKRGNPVLFGAAHFEALLQIEGDMGGRAVVEANRDAVCEVAMPDDAVLKDVDTPDALAAWSGDAKR